jgi:hypothetical protein
MRKYIATAVMLLVPVFAAMGQQMPHEEQVVRTTYAKLSFADETRIVLDALQQGEQATVDKALNSRLDFQLSNFKIGPIKEIAGRITADVAGIPADGNVLEVQPSTFNRKEDGQANEYVLYAKVKWTKAPGRFTADSWPLGEVLALAESGGPYQRYASYTVTVTFANNSRTYDTVAVFGTPPANAADTTEKVHFLDVVTGPSMLDLLSRTRMFPSALVKTKLRNTPVVRRWLRDNEQQACGKDNDVCCDLAAGRCGVQLKDLPTARMHRYGAPRPMMASFHPRVPIVKPIMFFQTDCSSYNTSQIFNHGLSDTSGHTTGQHTFISSISTGCSYSNGPFVGSPCNAQCITNASSTMTDAGTLSGILNNHVTAVVDFSGTAASNAGSTFSCQGTTAGSVVNCLSSSCSVGLSINASSNGVGATVTFPTATVFNDSAAGKQDCSDPLTPSSPSGPCISPTPTGPRFTTNQTGDGSDATSCSPIIIDLSGQGFNLTSAANGVMFDIANTGVPIRLAWTADSTNAFLALDRNNSGTITNGAELFGNFTPQPQSATPNGFNALAVYDQPANGGNGDGVIDAHDAIFAQLRLWVDANHDGICQSGELHTLPELGVYSISLDYQLSGRTDQYGNVFRYKASVNRGMHDASGVGPSAYDVFLTGK